MTEEQILELADQVTNDFEGVSYRIHNEEAWLIEFAMRLEQMIVKRGIDDEQK